MTDIDLFEASENPTQFSTQYGDWAKKNNLLNQVESRDMAPFQVPGGGSIWGNTTLNQKRNRFIEETGYTHNPNWEYTGPPPETKRSAAAQQGGGDLFGPDAGAGVADVIDTSDVFGGEGTAAPDPAATEAPDITPVDRQPREVQPEETMQGQFADLFADDNPIMEIATQRQLRAENKRGMLNSGGGQQRGEMSGILAGLEIAGKDAATYARAAELNQSYEEAQNLAEQSFEHNWNLNNQLKDNAASLSYQEFQQGIQASIQTFKEQSALMLQQLKNNLDLSDKDQQELLELTTVQHENTIKEIEAQGEIAKESALEQIGARGAIEMAQLIKGSELTIDQLIAKGDIDIDNILVQLGAQHGYVIAEMVKGGEITIDQLVKQGEIDLELIKAQAHVTHQNKVLEMVLQKDLNLDQIAAQGGIDKDRVLSAIGAQLGADMVKAVQNNEITLGQLVAQGDIDSGLLAQRLSTEHTNRLIEMYEAGDITIEQMILQKDLNKENMLDQISAQLSADKSMQKTAHEFNLNLTDFQFKLSTLRDAQQSYLRREEMGVQLQNELEILEERTADSKEIADHQEKIQKNLMDKQSDLNIIENNSQFANRLIEIQAQTAAQKQLSADSGARQLQSNYLIESGSMLRQAMQDIAQINTTEGLTSTQQTLAIQKVRQSLQRDLNFLQELYSSSPAWDPGWIYEPPPDLGIPPGGNPPEDVDPGYDYPGPVFGGENPPGDLYPLPKEDVVPPKGPGPGGGGGEGGGGEGYY